VVELNARFHSGTSALALVARAQRVGLAEGSTAFHVGASPSPFAGRRVEIFADEPDLGLWLSH